MRFLEKQAAKRSGPRVLLAVLSVILLMGNPERGLAMDTEVDKIDLARYMGDWYVQGHIPTFPEKGAFNSIESYRLMEDGTIAVQNSFRFEDPDKKPRKLTAHARIKDTETNAEWRIQFFWPIRFPFLVEYLDREYTKTIIGLPGKQFVWIMSRERVMGDAEYNRMVELIRSDGYDISKLRRVPQIWE